MTAPHTAALAHADAQAVHTATTVMHRLTPGTACGDPTHYTATVWHGTAGTERTYTATGADPIVALTAAMALLGVAIGGAE